MVSKTQRNSRRRGRKAVTDVRVVDTDSGRESSRVMRMLEQVHMSHEQIRVVVSSTFPVVGQSTAFTNNYGYVTVVSSDEYQSFSQQYNQFRIVGARFDVYNLTPNAGIPAVASTFHSDLINPPAASYLNVVDSSDAKVIIGNERNSWFWLATGPDELSFQDTVNTVSTAVEHGGLQLALPAPSTGLTLQVVCKFIVDFRGRA